MMALFSSHPFHIFSALFFPLVLLEMLKLEGFVFFLKKHNGPSFPSASHFFFCFILFLFILFSVDEERLSMRTISLRRAQRKVLHSPLQPSSCHPWLLQHAATPQVCTQSTNPRVSVHPLSSQPDQAVQGNPFPWKPSVQLSVPLSYSCCHSLMLILWLFHWLLNITFSLSFVILLSPSRLVAS